MHVKYEDDKKGKYQSVTAQVTFQTQVVQVHMEGYGFTETEAREELVANMAKFMADINQQYAEFRDDLVVQKMREHYADTQKPNQPKT